MKKRAFLVNALVLTVTSLFLRSVGMSFNVYISNKVGAEGMGLFQLISSAYALAITFATSGISLAVTRVVAEELGRGSFPAANKAVRQCFVYSLGMGLLAGVLLFVFAEPIGSGWLGETRTVLSLRLLAPSLPFIAMSACMRGYFVATRNIVKSSLAQVVEQFSTILVTVACIGSLLSKGLEYACLALVIGSVVGEIASWLVEFWIYRADKRKRDTSPCAQKGLFKRVLGISVPIAVSTYLRSGLTTVENVLIPRGFKQYGATGGASLAQYGMIKGMVMPVMFFPSAFLVAVSGLLVPEVAEANILGEKGKIDSAIERVFQMTLLFAILLTGVFFTFSHELGMAIYQNEECGRLLRILAPLVPLMYLDSVVDSMLKGLNEQVNSMKYNIIDSAMRVVGIWLLVPMFGVRGFIVVMYCSELLNTSLSLNRLIQVTQVRMHVTDWIVKPVLCIMTACVLSGLASRFLFSGALSGTASVVLVIVCACLLYMLFLFVTQCLTGRDVRWVFSVFKNEKESAHA